MNDCYLQASINALEAKDFGGAVCFKIFLSSVFHQQFLDARQRFSRTFQSLKVKLNLSSNHRIRSTIVLTEKTTPRPSPWISLNIDFLKSRSNLMDLV